VTLSRETVVPGMLDEYQAFEELVRGTSDEDWERPTRCEDWRVADVASHVIGQLTDVVNLRLDGLGSPEVTARQVEEHRGWTPGRLADELKASAATAKVLGEAFDDDAWQASAPGGTTGTLGFGMESLWFDTYLHGDDIRDALGQPSQSGEGLVASVSHIAQVLTDQGWGPATLAFEDMDAFQVGVGGARRINGIPLMFVLVATGRADPGVISLDETVNIYR